MSKITNEYLIVTEDLEEGFHVLADTIKEALKQTEEIMSDKILKIELVRVIEYDDDDEDDEIFIPTPPSETVNGN